MNPDARRVAADTADSLAKLRDEIDLKIHLAKMDASDAWKSVKPEVERIEKNLRSLFTLEEKKPLPVTHSEKSPASMLLDETELQLHLALMNVKSAWEKIEPRISPIVGHLNAAGDAVSAAFTPDKASRVRSHKEAEERRMKVRASLKRAASELTIALNEAVQEITERVDGFRSTLNPPAFDAKAAAKEAKKEAKAARRELKRTARSTRRHARHA